MTYQTLYRKYRSTNFSELVGQEHIIKTLSNAIEYNRLSHAYIFSGPRGTGKTSTARILAKMVNKTTDKIDDCEICKKITTGVCVDVIEIDAASHTGVDHMRQLTEQVQFLPIEATYKVFIIDEVHMLSTGAFNALLKTLEEPPANILFILATTELHKIPATIQSRAQTLHFRLLENNQIKEHLQHICSQEGISIDESVLLKVIQSSNGGMRDALSLLDQLMSVCTNSTVTMDDVAMVLGTMTESVIIDFLTDCFAGSQHAVSKLNGFINQGINVFQFYDDVLNYLNQHFLVSKSHNFDATDAVISDWMLWFCDQLSRLKSVPYVDIAAQVGLNTKLLGPVQVVQAQPASVAPQQVAATVQPTQSYSQSQQPAVKSHQNDQPNTPIEPQSNMVQSRATNQEGASVGGNQTVAEKSHTKADVVEHIIAKVNEEFKVLAPVLTGATFIEQGDVLCLVLEQSYQFFEKKLSEQKYQVWFLQEYNRLANTNFDQWFVTSDVNQIYKFAEQTNDDKIESSKDYIQSNTVNQIVEMFDAHVIH